MGTIKLPPISFNKHNVDMTISSRYDRHEAWQKYVSCKKVQEIMLSFSVIGFTPNQLLRDIIKMEIYFACSNIKTCIAMFYLEIDILSEKAYEKLESVKPTFIKKHH